MATPAGEWLTTTTLLHGLADPANGAAWGRFVERFRPPLLAYLLRSGVREHDADDLAQEALIEFARAFGDGRYDRARGRLSAWLFGIALHCVLRHRQRAGRGREAPLGDAEFWSLQVDEKSSDAAWDSEWERWVWQECLRRVRHEFEATTLRAFVLVAREERTPSEAAEELGVPIKAVYNAKHRVLNRLRELRVELEDVR